MSQRLVFVDGVAKLIDRDDGCEQSDGPAAEVTPGTLVDKLRAKYLHVPLEVTVPDEVA